MRTRTTKWLALFGTLLAATFFVPKFAVGQDRDSDDPPSRAARLSFTGGPVSFEPAGTDDWVTIVANRPITTGDKLWTDKDGRAELRFGSTAVRLGSETGFSFLNLDDRTAQIRLTEGTINVRVKRLDEDETIEIDTPNLAFTVLRPGNYRISVNEGGDNTFIKVRGGDGEVTGGGAAYAIHADQSGNFNGTDQLSADTQKNNKQDVAITRDIRRAIVADKNLSTYAHNVKVITQNGEVTLKGPVRSEDERKTIEAKAIEVAGQGRVANELTVATKAK